MHKKLLMNIFSFTAHFDNEESCRYHFKEERDKITVESTELDFRKLSMTQ